MTLKLIARQSRQIYCYCLDSDMMRVLAGYSVAQIMVKLSNQNTGQAKACITLCYRALYLDWGRRCTRNIITKRLILLN